MRCGSGGTPAGSLVGGRIADVEAVGTALRQLIARTDILETRALVAASDATAIFRILSFGATATDQEVEASVARDMQLVPKQMSTHWVDLKAGGGDRMVYAVAWDRSLIGKIAEVVKIAGLELAAVDLKSACIARVVAVPSSVVVDISSDPAEALLIDQHVPRLWHSFPLDVLSDELESALAAPLRSVLKYYNRNRAQKFGRDEPIFISGEPLMAPAILSGLAHRLGHPVHQLPLPARVPPEVRYGTFLTCIGLIMRRTA